MGFQLFETSGTFNPASWGLKAGDMLYILAIGGGGGGGSNGYGDTTAATNGSSSSFGSVVTAAGGNAANHTLLGSIQTGSVQGSMGYISNSICIGGSGGDGWYPGIGVRHAACLNLQIGPSDTFGHTAGTTMHTSSLQTPSTVNRAQNGGASAESELGGAGGVGYGAGGGGGVHGTSYYQSAGGNSGCLIIKSYQLTSTASIAVTVGNGGKGGYMSNWSNYGGGGARGCVYVFW